jgi:Cys-tRNA(Pro) deacylase
VPKHPVTMAIRVLRAAGIAFVPRLYAWQPHGGTRASSIALGVPEHAVIKTLIFEIKQGETRQGEIKQGEIRHGETRPGEPLCVLMHGDREVSVKQLARDIGAKTVGPCAPDVADRHSGYQVGGTSPFGLRRPMPIYMQSTILELPRIYINGGARGFLVELDPQDARRVLTPVMVDVAVE